MYSVHVLRKNSNNKTDQENDDNVILECQEHQHSRIAVSLLGW